MFGQLLLGMKNRPPHVRESGFWKEGNFRIWYIQNPENLSFGILIFGIRKTAQEEFGTPLTIRSGIQAPVTKNRESWTWNPEIYNLHSWSQDCLGSLTWGEGGGTIALPSLTFYGPLSPSFTMFCDTSILFIRTLILAYYLWTAQMKWKWFHFIYDLFQISLTLISFTGNIWTNNWPAPNVSGFIAQLIEHRTGIARSRVQTLLKWTRELAQAYSFNLLGRGINRR